MIRKRYFACHCTAGSGHDLNRYQLYCHSIKRGIASTATAYRYDTAVPLLMV
jgi:hypothetical protein